MHNIASAVKTLIIHLRCVRSSIGATTAIAEMRRAMRLPFPLFGSSGPNIRVSRHTTKERSASLFHTDPRPFDSHRAAARVRRSQSVLDVRGFAAATDRAAW
jgi:hypothetical protein